MLSGKASAACCGLLLTSSLAFATDISAEPLTEGEAAASVIKPLVGGAHMRGMVDAFMHITINIAHDVVHPNEPEMFGAQPGFIRVLEALRSASGEISDVCELSGGYRIQRIVGHQRSDELADDSEADESSDNGLFVMRLTYDGCRLNRYGSTLELSGPITFRLMGVPESDQFVIRGVRFGARPFGDNPRFYETASINEVTQQVEGVARRNYIVRGLIPTELHEEFGYMGGELRARIHGEISGEGQVSSNNELVDTNHKVVARKVHVRGSSELQQEVHPVYQTTERAFITALNFTTGSIDAESNQGAEHHVSHFESTGLSLRDVEFVDSENGSHYLSFDGRADIDISIAPESCRLGKFSVKTLRPLYVPYAQFHPAGGAIVVDRAVHATFAEDSSVTVSANDETVHYIDFQEVNAAAQCFIY